MHSVIGYLIHKQILCAVKIVVKGYDKHIFIDIYRVVTGLFINDDDTPLCEILTVNVQISVLVFISRHRDIVNTHLHGLHTLIVLEIPVVNVSLAVSSEHVVLKAIEPFLIKILIAVVLVKLCEYSVVDTDVL